MKIQPDLFSFTLGFLIGAFVSTCLIIVSQPKNPALYHFQKCVKTAGNVAEAKTCNGYLQ